MKPGERFLIGWLTFQWVVSALLVPPATYMFASDTHGLPTTLFYVATTLILVITTIGYWRAISTLKSLRENA